MCKSLNFFIWKILASYYAKHQKPLPHIIWPHSKCARQKVSNFGYSRIRCLNKYHKLYACICTENESIDSVFNIYAIRCIEMHISPTPGDLNKLFIHSFKLMHGNPHTPESEPGFVCRRGWVTPPYYIAGLKEKMKCLKSRLRAVCCVVFGVVPACPWECGILVWF